MPDSHGDVKGKYYINMEFDREYKVNQANNISYKRMLTIADKIGKYLGDKNAILVSGSGKMRSDSMIDCYAQDFEWIYHVDNTTLFAYVRPDGMDPDDPIDTLYITAAGEHPGAIISDLEKIIEETGAPKKPKFR